ncbi:unnamed protein product [Adineta ricciae]|uniref:G-protein coupled receptors family 1 profile domain-containing protein n=1 Tax=Adineta ricciae TaxID=249248 RepID=A0A815KQJ5_ADIRI|nr:unnamed protein product [Adineta ricciae]CAF1396331.1 unnamed protein product [Adineta ricciae]
MFLKGIFWLIFICLLTIVGNCLVILAVYRERSLHNATYYYIVSLSLADLCVGILVIPFAIFFEIFSVSPSKYLCQIWHITDVGASTASILALCVISIDRYKGIRSPITYSQSFLRKHSSIVIGSIWFCSGFLSVPFVLFLGEKNSSEIQRCKFPSDPIFVLISSLISFYIPLIIMVFVYGKILIFSRKQIQAFRQGYKQTKSLQEMSSTPFFLSSIRLKKPSQRKSSNERQQITLRIHKGKYNQSSPDNSPLDHRSSSLSLIFLQRLRNIRRTRSWSRFSHEHKAAKVLGIVMGAFIACWLPFFLFHSLTSIFHLQISSQFQQELFRLFTYLGYTNSALNFFVYALTSKEFRLAFIKLLCPRHYVQKTLFKHYYHHQQRQLQNI